MSQLLKSLVFALSVCAAVHAPVLAKGSPESAAHSASGAASAPDAPPQPVKFHPVANEAEIRASHMVSKRLVDAPIVRSSRGCIGYLGETESGSIIVVHLLGKNGKPACLPEYGYRTGVDAKK